MTADTLVPSTLDPTNRWVFDDTPEGKAVLDADRAIQKLDVADFEVGAERQLLEPFKALLPTVLFMRRSPRHTRLSHYDYHQWCVMQFGGTSSLIIVGAPSMEKLADGRTLHTRNRHFNPDGTWLLIRHTLLFKDEADAIWFRMVWW